MIAKEMFEKRRIPNLQCLTINMKELQAITKQVEELDWIVEEVEE